MIVLVNTVHSHTPVFLAIPTIAIVALALRSYIRESRKQGRLQNDKEG